MSFLDCYNDKMKFFLESQDEKSKPALQKAFDKRMESVKKAIGDLDPADINKEQKIQRIMDNMRFNVRRDTVAINAQYKAIDKMETAMKRKTVGGDTKYALNAIDMVKELQTVKDVYLRKASSILDSIDIKDSSQINTQNILKELEGFVTGDKKSQEIADAIRKYQDFMFNEKNYAGLYIEKKSTYDIKRRYNREKIRAIGKEEFVKDNLESGYIKIFDKTKPKSQVLGEIYDTLIKTSDSLVSIEDIALNKKGTDFSKLTAGQTLEFNEGKFADFNEKYGYNILEHLVMDISDNAKKLANVKVLGPNPDITLSKMNKLLLNEGLPEADINKIMKSTKALHDFFNEPAQDANSFTKVWQSVRSLSTSTIMGLSAIKNFFGDTAMNGLTSKARGSSFFKTLYNVLGSFAGKEKDKYAEFIGLNNGAAMFDALQDIYGLSLTNIKKNKMDKLSDFFWKANFVDSLTKRQRIGFSRAFYSDLSINKNLSFEEVDLKMNKTLSNNGINAKDWEVYQKSTGEKFWNSELTTHKNIEDVRVAEKFEMMHEREMNKSVITSSLESKAMANFYRPKGTATGELALTLTQFYQWSQVFYRNVQNIALYNGMSNINKVKLLGSSVAAFMLFDYMGESTKELIKGNTPKFSAEGYSKSFFNVFGVLGDTINSLIWYGNVDLTDKPVFGLYQNLAGIPLEIGKSIKQKVSGKEGNEKEANVMNKVYKLSKDINPLTNNIATKSIFRFIDESVMEMIDPKELKRKKGREKSRLKENNQVKIMDLLD